MQHWWPHFLRTGELDFYPYTAGADRETIRALWNKVEYQVLFHSMDHRSQTLAMLHKVGGPTVEQDFLTYLKDPVIQNAK